MKDWKDTMTLEERAKELLDAGYISKESYEKMLKEAKRRKEINKLNE